MKINVFLLVLAAVLAVPTWLVMRAERARFTEVKDIPLLFDGFNAAAVAAVRVAKGWNDPAPDQKAQQAQPPIEELQFRRQDQDKWILANTELAGAPARAQKIHDELLEHLARIRRDEKAVHRANASAEELQQFGLDKEQGYLIVAYDAQNRVLAELVVGKDVSGGQWEASRVHGRYVRAKANDSVLVYETDFFSPSVVATEWVDLRIYQADLSKAVGFSIFNDTVEQPVEFKRDQPTQAEWKVAAAPPKTGAARQGDLTELMQKVSLLDAARFLAPLQPNVLKARGLDLDRIGLDPPSHTISFTLEDGESIALALGKKLEDKPEVYARSNKSQFLFTVPDWFKASLEIDVKGKLLDPSADALRDQPRKDGGEGGKKDDDKDGDKGADDKNK
jgi:hypothetical protein